MKRLTKKILLFINLVLAIALCLGYLSNFVSPTMLWVFAFFGLAYPLLLLLNIGFVLFWWWRKKKAAFLSLLCILIGFGNIGRYFQPNFPAKIKSDTESTKVISYNVRIFNHFEWEKKDAVRDSILSFLNSEKANIICLQEFLTRKNHPTQNENYLLAKLPNTPKAHVVYTTNLNNGPTKFGLATYCSYPIVNKGEIRFKNSHNACIYTDMLIDKDTVRVFNLHLQSTRIKKYDSFLMDSLKHLTSERFTEFQEISSSLKKGFIERSRQVKKIVEVVESSPYQVILCGDFNDTPVSHTYHKLLGNKKDAFREAGSGFSNTYRGRLPSYRIDYIFCSEGFTVSGYTTKLIPLSDHYPVISVLKKATIK